MVSDHCHILCHNLRHHRTAAWANTFDAGLVVEFGALRGSWCVGPDQNIFRGNTVSTNNMPLTLFALRDYLQSQNQPVFMWQLTTTFNCSPETIRPLLERWILKGQVIQSQQTPCQGCMQRCNACQLQCWSWHTNLNPISSGCQRAQHAQKYPQNGTKTS